VQCSVARRRIDASKNMPEIQDFEYDIFLSHNQKDKVRVHELAQRLKDAGIRVWLDDWVIKPGDDIYLAVERGLAESRVQLLCLSQAALDSNWVTMERNTVLFRDPCNAGRRFIPILLADCNLPDTLRRYRYVDLRETSAAGFDELLAVCRRETESPSAAPDEPAKIKPKSSKRESQPLAMLERELTGHRGWVKSVAVSPDSTWAVSGSTDQTVRIWDLEDSRPLATLAGHARTVDAVAITPDGNRILSGSGDGTVRIWDAHAFEQVRSFQLDGPAVAVCPLPDNERALIGLLSPTASLAMWSLLDQRCLWNNENAASLVNSIAIDRAGSVAVSGHLDSKIRIWAPDTGELLGTLAGHTEMVNSVGISEDGRFAISGSIDRTIRIWDLEARSCVATLEGHQNLVQSVDIAPNGRLIASAGFTDNTLRLWDFDSGECLQVIGTKAPATCVSFSHDGSRLIVGTGRYPIYVYRVQEARSIRTAGGGRRYVNAKVVLLGEGTVGKTSLAHRLIDDEYVVRDRTHGMNVWPLELPFAANSQLEQEALLWDLAGQEDYRLIHRLFLDETALALLLINPQKDDPFAEAGDWLRALETAASHDDARRDPTRLLIFSQIDVGGMKLGNTKIERFQKDNGFSHWLPTSAKTGENCSDGKNGGQPSKLKRLIADSIPWNKLPWTATPRLLAELKNAVMTMRDAADIRLVRFGELLQRLEQALPGEHFGESDVRTAVTLLANHGLARPLKFGDLVLLQPELLNGYAGAIIRAARAHTDEIGSVPEAAIYRPDFDFTGVERLTHRPDEELLLRAMVQTLLDKSLCIAEETPNGRHLVFPSQYRREKDLRHDPEVFISYSFHGEWQTIWTTLVVRLWYSQEFKHRDLWRNAAEFASDKNDILGLKIANRQGEGQATISVYFDAKLPDELKMIFIRYVHRHLKRNARDVTRDRRYVCSACGAPIRDLEAVRRRLAAGKQFITCQECDNQVQLIDFIEQQLESDPIARSILVMEVIATRKLDIQSLEQILTGHVQAITDEANQLFRSLTHIECGIDGEVEFKDNDGRASGKRIYVQLKSGNYYKHWRTSDGREVFEVKNEEHLEYWQSQPVDIYLLMRQTDEKTREQSILWMNVTRYLRNRKEKESRQIVFEGEPLTMEAVWKTRDAFFPPRRERAPTSPA
jgi:WD40 repeat protein